MSATVTTVADDRIGRAREAAQPDAARVATYRAYVLGEQDVTLSDEMKADLAGILGDGKKYVDNLCRLAIQAHADFLKLARIEIDAPDTTARRALADFIADTWSLNQLPELSSDVHFAAPRDGNYAVAASWDKRTERVRFTQLDWWNGERGAFVHYDDGGLPDWAVYEWGEFDPETKTTVGRRVVYYPDRMERFVRREGAGAWEAYNLPDDTTIDGTPIVGGEPVPWTDRAGAPIGIPIVPFPNLLIPNHQPGTSSRETSRRYGLSLLAGGPLGVQDAINEAHYDLIAAARRTAFPILWATGIKPPKVKDKEGNTVDGQIAAVPGMMVTNPDSQGQFGILNPGDMSQLLAVLVDHHRTFARMTNTPMQIVAETDKDAASGVALLRMMLSAIRQARRAMTVYGSRWGMLFHKATMIANAFGNADLDADMMLTGVYDPAELSDLPVMAEVAKDLREAGFPMTFILESFGKTEEQIAKILADIDRENATAPATTPPATTGDDSDDEAA